MTISKDTQHFIISAIFFIILLGTVATCGVIETKKCKELENKFQHAPLNSPERTKFHHEWSTKCFLSIYGA